MEDELNMDPRETDYMDDYDMDRAMNFFELTKQLADLGFSEPVLVNTLRKILWLLNAQFSRPIAGSKKRATNCAPGLNMNKTSGAIIN